MRSLIKPNIVLIVARGEAVRNFLYSDTLRELNQNARVTLLSVITDDGFRERFGSQVDRIIELKEYQESRVVRILRELITFAHYRWIWTEKVKNKWELMDFQACTISAKVRTALLKFFAYLFANRIGLSLLAKLEYFLSIRLNPTKDFEQLFAELKPDLVFNCSHIHAARGELPVRVAHQMGIRTATFVFSWDNLSSRGRILPPYDHFFVWHTGMQAELLSLYPQIKPGQVSITGTPQFDYHFQPDFCLSKEDLCARLGIDPSVPYVLYTTGMDRDFPEEHRHVEAIIEIVKSYGLQLVVRTYVKGTSPEMKALSKAEIPGVIFPPVMWDEKWFTPKYEDLAVYTSLLKYASFGINPASTVSLELMMFDKPVINIGFNPPGSSLPHCLRWKRHIEFDHYRKVADSGCVMVAYSMEDMQNMIQSAVENPKAHSAARRVFLERTFDGTLDGKAGQRVAAKLVQVACE